jgi:transaldolase
VSIGRDGFVSFECTPDLADDADSTIEQAIEVRNRLGLPNLLIKVAARHVGAAG